MILNTATIWMALVDVNRMFPKCLFSARAPYVFVQVDALYLLVSVAFKPNIFCMFANVFDYSVDVCVWKRKINIYQYRTIV